MQAQQLFLSDLLKPNMTCIISTNSWQIIGKSIGLEPGFLTSVCPCRNLFQNLEQVPDSHFIILVGAFQVYQFFERRFLSLEIFYMKRVYVVSIDLFEVVESKDIFLMLEGGSFYLRLLYLLRHYVYKFIQQVTISYIYSD